MVHFPEPLFSRAVPRLRADGTIIFTGGYRTLDFTQKNYLELQSFL